MPQDGIASYYVVDFLTDKCAGASAGLIHLTPINSISSNLDLASTHFFSEDYHSSQVPLLAQALVQSALRNVINIACAVVACQYI